MDGKVSEKVGREKKNILYINCCMRKESRTQVLAGRYLKYLEETQDIVVREIKVSQLNLQPLNEETLSQRDADIRNGNLDKDAYEQAHLFAMADKIIIAAPYWDCLFPAALKIYIENICVNTVTIGYDDMGRNKKLCKAEELLYITSCGGPLQEGSGLEVHMNELGRLFAIDKVRVVAADCLDMYPDRVPELIDQAYGKLCCLR